MEPSREYKRVYVWEQPVRWFHWINAACVIVLGVTGYLIAHPFALLSADEASFGYWVGTNRFIHFLTAYVFVGNFGFRLYWAFVGNKYARWRNFLPLRRWQLRQARDVLKVDILQSSDKVVHTLGHNSVAYFTYFGTALLTLFMIFSGYALYAPTSEAWFPQLFNWMMPLFGSEQNLRLFHYAGLWFFAVFIVIHVYLCFYHDYVEGHGVLLSIVGGWKFMEKRKAEAEEASGISEFVVEPKRSATDAAKRDLP
ncbi:MAG: Ni/Fe-hydrogenase, b-type cytochrome subunit [Candidatus Didemnitutus sp.]|nr:Ni/Fe-hydrogenase, b-type cytochrome subunit [Candidatus Didemnitutus sp.]